MSLAFVIVLGLGAPLPGATLTAGKVAGTVLIMAGVFVLSR